MPIDLRQTDASKTAQVGSSGRSLAAGTPIAREMTEGGTAGTTEALPAVENLGTTLVAYNDISDAIGETTWAAGTLTWRLNIPTTSTTLTLEEVYVDRLNSSEVQQENLGSSTGIGRALGTAQVESGTVTLSAATSPADTDLLAVIYIFTNTHEHGGDDAVGITPDQLINTPIESTSSQSVVPVVQHHFRMRRD